MAFRHQSRIVAAFTDEVEARQAVSELRSLGLGDSQIGVVTRHNDFADGHRTTTTNSDETYAGEGAAAGVATGAGIGALWGLGIVAGVMPIIGPAIAGGTLAAILSSAAAGAITAGLAGTLIGMGIEKEEAEFFESEFQEGRTVITVDAPGRESEVMDVMLRHGGYSRTTAPTLVGSNR